MKSIALAATRALASLAPMSSSADASGYGHGHYRGYGYGHGHGHGWGHCEWRRQWYHGSWRWYRYCR